MKSKIVPYVSVAVFIFTLILSICLFISRSFGNRYVFYFKSYDSNHLCAEIRYLPKNSVQGDIALFVDELLLGPMTNRYKKIVPYGTAREFCFEKNGTVYLGLNDNALLAISAEDNVKSRVNLLQENIVKNFTNINKIDVFIDGKSVVE